MKQQNIDNWIIRYPELFRYQQSERNDISVGDGWYDILTHLFDELEKLEENLSVSQIKQKFGPLRIYFSGVLSEEARALVNQAVDQSQQTCEECGRSGKMTASRGFYRIVCSDHERLGCNGILDLCYRYFPEWQ